MELQQRSIEFYTKLYNGNDRKVWRNYNEDFYAE